MITLPAMDLRRTYLIARRDFLGYVRTWGFWLSFFLPLLFGAVGFAFSQLQVSLEPVVYDVILDDTGEHAEGIFAERAARIAERERRVFRSIGQATLNEDDAEELLVIFDRDGRDAASAFLNEKYPGVSEGLKFPPPKGEFVDNPATDLESLQPYLRGETMLEVDGREVKLNGVLHLYETENRLQADYWSPNINSNYTKSIAGAYFRDRAAARYLASGGLTPQGLDAAQSGGFSIDSFNPTKSQSSESEKDGFAVTETDRIPYFVAGIMTIILWLTIFSGSYMLLTSMLEEKLNKLLEMMLASTRLSEIVFGKLIGVAALTLTAMLPYILIAVAAGIFLLMRGDPDAIAGLTQAFTPKLIVFFVIFLLLGYIFYGAMFIALGALANSMQDAQTLTTPIMLILTACVMVVPLGIESPDAPILRIASFFPLSAPFASIIRLPSDPPWWELILSAVLVLAMALLVISLAGRVFRYGVMSGAGVKGIRAWFSRVIFRRKMTP